MDPSSPYQSLSDPPPDPLTNPVAIWATRLAVALAVLTVALWSILDLLNPANRAGDFYWGLVQGKWVLAHHSVLRHDQFSYALHHAPMVQYEWVHDLLLALAQRYVGATAFVFLGYGAVLAVTLLYLHRRGAPLLRQAIIMVSLAWFFTPYVAQDRALTLSLILFPLLLVILRRARTSPAFLLALPPLFVLWINTHGSALLGIGVLTLELFLAWLSPSLTRRPPPSPYRWSLLVCLLVSVSALLITPWGPGLLTHNLSLAGSSQLHHYIAEWQPVNLANPRWLLVLAALIALLVRSIRHRMPIFEISLVVILSAAWLDTNRVLPYLVVAALGLFVIDPVPLATPRWTRMLLTTSSVGVILAAALALGSHQFTSTNVEVAQPVTAAAYLKSHHDTGRVLAFSSWGGYLMNQGWMSFVDGRFDLFLGHFLSVSNTLAETRGYNPEPLLDHYQVSYVIWPDQLALTRDLLHDPHWVRVQDKDGISLFVRANPNPYAAVSGLVPLSAR